MGANVQAKETATTLWEPKCDGLKRAVLACESHRASRCSAPSASTHVRRDPVVARRFAGHSRRRRLTRKRPGHRPSREAPSHGRDPTDIEHLAEIIRDAEITVPAACYT